MYIEDNLGKAQQEVYDMLILNFLTPTQIANRRYTSKKNVYKLIDKLIKKGYIIRLGRSNYTKGGVTKHRGVTISDKKTTINQYKIRLHNVQISIKIIKKIGITFRNNFKKSNKLNISGSTIILYENYIEIFTSEGLSFFGDSVNESYQKAILYFKKIYTKIENRLGVIIDKDQYLNKRWVRQHIAHTNDDMAIDYNKNDEKLVIYDDIDSKQRVIVDDSFGMNELEAVHSKKAKPDMERYKAFLTDMLERPDLVTLSHLTFFHKELMGLIKANAKEVSAMLEAIGKNAESIQEIKEIINKIYK